MDIQVARENLSKFSPCPTGTSIRANYLSDKPSCDLQIIVPAYNVELYLRECMDSILSQETQYSYEIFLIDDGSADGTGSIADEYAADCRVHVMHQKNKGFSGARNAGLQHIVGKYISFVDSDDRLAPGAIEALMSIVLKEDALIVEGGSYSLSSGKLYTYYKHNQIECVSPLGNLKGYPWGKVFRSDIFANLIFPEGYWFEDSIMAFLIYSQIKTAYLIPDIVYVYRDNPQGISNTANKRPKCIDTYWITERLMEDREALSLDKDMAYYEQIMNQIILNYKRVRFMPVEIRQSIFILTKNLLEKHLGELNPPSKYKYLIETLEKSDFGAFELSCLMSAISMKLNRSREL